MDPSRPSTWTPDHWMMMVAFVGVLGLCLYLLKRSPPMQVPGVPSHDLANRLQTYISEIDERVRDMPRPREVREMAERIRALETVTASIQSDVRAGRESNGRIEHRLDMLIEAGLERDQRGAPT